MKIAPIKEVYKIKSENGHEYYSKRKPMRDDESLVETIPFDVYLEINGANIAAINRARNG